MEDKYLECFAYAFDEKNARIDFFGQTTVNEMEKMEDNGDFDHFHAWESREDCLANLEQYINGEEGYTNDDGATYEVYDLLGTPLKSLQDITW